ncbi:MAG: 1-phosphofructokinase [Planctomycetota bacterium]|jgi:6-phosphofructokinase 2
MIYTVTLNPALDRILDVEDLVPDDANRVVLESRWAGGKGIDASRVIYTLGGASVAMGFIGGFTGLELEGRLVNEGVLTKFIRCAGETRTNVYVRNRSTGTQTALNCSGPRILPQEIAQIFNQIRDLSDADHVLISGSLPKGVNEGFYNQLIMTLKEKGAFVALDTDGAPLKRSLEARPDLIKPNRHEFGRLTGCHSTDLEELVAASRALIDGGVGSVLLTLGGDGMVFTGPGEPAVFSKAPPVEAVSPIGAGDATLGAFVLQLALGRDETDCLRMAAAAGAATAMTPGVELCHPKDVEKLLPKVEVREI